jgi:hypothetical protein
MTVKNYQVAAAIPHSREKIKCPAGCGAYLP